MSPYIILIAAMAFIVTVGALHIDQSSDTSAYLPTIEQVSPQVTTVAQRISKSKPTHKPTKAQSPTPSQIMPVVSIPNTQTTVTPSPLTTIEKSITPTPLITLETQATPSQNPSVALGLATTSTTPIPSPNRTQVVHTYYTSSHWKAKYYYCDTDVDWKELSDAYRKSYQDQQSLLSAFPNRTLHKPCEG